jgi:hypothetical protein
MSSTTRSRARPGSGNHGGMPGRILSFAQAMPRGRSARAAIPVLLALLALARGAAAPAADVVSRPLPDARSFLEAVRDSLHSDQTLLAEYTFTEKHVESKLDSKGGVKSTKTEVYEVYPSSKPGHIYRRLVMVDGKPVDPKDLADEDRKHDAKMEKRRLELENETPEQKQRRLEKDAEDLRQEREVIEELFRMDSIEVAGRETLEGRSAVLVTFQPKPGFLPQTKGGKVLQKLAGRAWIDEEEKQLVRIDAQLLDALPVGPGGVFRLQKGARALFERRRVNDEVWLPAQARFSGAAKILLFVLGRLDATSEYGDYRKFTVSTSTDIGSIEHTTN